MIAIREERNYPHPVKVWAGKYRNSHNLLHWHYECELLFVEKGSIDVFCERQTHTLGEGESLFIDRGQVHYMDARTADTTLGMLIFDDGILRPYFGEIRLVSPKLSGNYPIGGLYTAVTEVLRSEERYAGTQAAALILGQMSRVFGGEETVPRTGEDETERKFMQLLERLHEQYEYITFSDAASFMGMSECYFSRYFHRVTGIPFSKHLNFVRTEHAVELMKTGLYPVTEIAARCGFGTIRNFNRVFREITGFAPRELPKDFRLGNTRSLEEHPFNPTRYDCELLEWAEG